MAAVSILALGTVMITQSNLMFMNVYNRYALRIGVQTLADEKIWEAKEKLFASMVPETGEANGQEEIANQTIQWSWSSRSATKDLYDIQLTMTAGEGPSAVQFTRATRIFVKSKKAG